MSDREALIEEFLAESGWAGAERTPLAGDASFRRYQRVTAGRHQCVLMDAPPDHEDVRPFILVAEHLRRLGLSAPEVLADDVGAGLLLLEDLGDDTYTRLLDADADEADLYELAIDVLIHLHRLPSAEAVPPGLPPYDDGRLLEEACLLTDWYLPAVSDRPTDDDREAYVAAWRDLFPAVHAQPRTLVLRDYHVDNLMRLAGRDGVAACGLLDFQDAVAGPPAYDLMSLLEDARRDIDAGLESAMLDRYREGVPHLVGDEFDKSYVILAAQRHAKVIGIFTRLCRRDGKHEYLVHIPRVWRLLERALENPTLAPVADWLDRHVPPAMRRIPPTGAAAQ